MRLESHEATDKFWLEPLTAFLPTEKDVKKLVSGYPLTKNELAVILKSERIQGRTPNTLEEEMLDHCRLTEGTRRTISDTGSITKTDAAKKAARPTYD